MGGSGRVRRVYDCYDPNPIQPTIKKNFIIQSNLLTPKNRPNSVSWVGLGQFWQVGGLAAHP